MTVVCTWVQSVLIVFCILFRRDPVEARSNGYIFYKSMLMPYHLPVKVSHRNIRDTARAHIALVRSQTTTRTGTRGQFFSEFTHHSLLFLVFLLFAQAQAFDAYAADGSGDDLLGMVDPDRLDIPPPLVCRMKRGVSVTRSVARSSGDLRRARVCRRVRAWTIRHPCSVMISQPRKGHKSISTATLVNP